MKVNVVNIEKAVAVYHNPQYQDETVFYLFTRPQDALAMVRQGKNRYPEYWRYGLASW